MDGLAPDGRHVRVRETTIAPDGEHAIQRYRVFDVDTNAIVTDLELPALSELPLATLDDDGKLRTDVASASIRPDSAMTS